MNQLASSDKQGDSQYAPANGLRGAQDSAYAERNELVYFLVILAVTRGWHAGYLRDESARPGYQTVIYIDLPTGQVSWHIRDDAWTLFGSLPPYRGRWDGHTKDERYRRLRSLTDSLLRGTETVSNLTPKADADLGGRLLVQRAVYLMESGNTDEARRALRSALESDPRLASAWYNLGEIGAYDLEGTDIRTMEALLRQDTLLEHDRILLHFGLGKAYLAADDYHHSFAHYREGNVRKRQMLRFDVGCDEVKMRDLADTYSADKLGPVDPGANLSDRPVFVVGMPRSGTSLVEQILASHPDVHGAGELLEIHDIAARCESTPREAWRTLADRYLSIAGAAAGNAMRIIDKLPLNFLYIGIIRALLPNARIIHCRRNPVDNGLSCYTTLFDFGSEFSYDLTEIGRFATAYTKLMNHWRYTTPPDRFLDVDYEAIVADVDTEARRLLAFCDLPWDDAVMRFYESNRLVRTASKVQVRRPIYSDSVNRAAKFGPALDPLRAALADFHPIT